MSTSDEPHGSWPGKRRKKHDDDVVDDGEGVRVPLYLADVVSTRFAFGDQRPDDVSAFDAAAHQRGYRTSTGDDAARLAARDEWLKRTGNAWRSPGRDAAPPDEPDGEEGNAAEAAASAYERSKQQLSNAWRHAPSVTPYRDPRTDELALRTAGALAPPRLTGAPLRLTGADAQRTRDAAYDKSVADLGNAWKMLPRSA